MNKIIKSSVLILLPVTLTAALWLGKRVIFSAEDAKETTDTSQAAIIQPQKPKYVRGIHLTSWVAGSSKIRSAIDKLLDETELNAVVIDVKEYEGEVYIPGVTLANENKTFVKAIPDVKDYIASLKGRGIYTVARIVVFKDNLMAGKKPQWGVQSAEGGLWKDRKGNAWLNPYSKEAWSYNLDVAQRAVELGFDEIQFDYIRFPSDGNTRDCRYGTAYSSTTSQGALNGFLEEANRRLKPMGVNLSIDVFGLTTTAIHDMGIGQKILDMAKWVDFVCPMVYPSHYAKGEYGIADPDAAPYRTVFMSMSGARKRMGEVSSKLRPYLQDFSLEHHYGQKEVSQQIQAAYDNDIGEWLLWNPRCVYTKSALKSKEFADVYEKTKTLTEQTTGYINKE